ncbi:MAG TPA: type II secretion system protein N [Burkholderiaceae bacterium]|nr:type II secretion system protein N [Burkholderiaceae bacterium]
MLARLSAFVIWALVAATAVFWGLRLLVRAPQAPAYAVPVGDATAVRADLTRLLGSAPVAAVSVAAAPEAASRFKLWGVVAARDANAAPGVALIAVDGKMPKAYPVGARIDDDLVLQSVSLRSASIAPSGGTGQTITLQLPPPVAAATGSLPLPGFGAPGMAPMPRPVPSFGQPMLPQQVAPRPDSGAPTQ